MPPPLVDKLIAYLEFQKEEGRTHLSLPRKAGETPMAVKAKPAPAPTASPAPARVTTPPSTPSPVKPTIPPPQPMPAMRVAAKSSTVDTILAGIAKRVSACTQCPLHEGRTNTVPGQGNANSPDILFIGEAPGEDEDLQGLAFVGRAGQLLTKMIQAMGYTRDEVFIANIAKCRPPDNRPPEPPEMEACMPFLLEQIAAIQPKVIIGLGKTSVHALLKTEVPISKLRGTWQTYNGTPFMPTYHPSYLLRSPDHKKEAWEDLKAVLTKLGRPIPTPPKGG